jgi:acetylornithine deacetylase/succinyl-diaminopimelate desuccinylase-like protein
MAQFESPDRAEMFRNFRQLMNQPGFKEKIAKDDLNPQVRNTISLTMLGGSQQTNVIPGEAWANLDVRLLPGEDPPTFLQKLKDLVNDPKVTIEPQSKEFRISNSSPTNTELFDTIRRVTAQYFGGAPVAPHLTSGYTENQRYRGIGIVSYGFSPYAVTEEESSTEHGDNERIRVEEVRRGFRIYYDVLVSLAGK